MKPAIAPQSIISEALRQHSNMNKKTYLKNRVPKQELSEPILPEEARALVLQNELINSAIFQINKLITESATAGKIQVEIKVKANKDAFAIAFVYLQQEIGYGVANITGTKAPESKTATKEAPYTGPEYYVVSWKFKKNENA